jgi:hypothetical protein
MHANLASLHGFLACTCLLLEIAIGLQFGYIAARLARVGDGSLSARTARWRLASQLVISKGIGAVRGAVLAASQSTRHRRSLPSACMSP